MDGTRLLTLKGFSCFKRVANIQALLRGATTRNQGTDATSMTRPSHHERFLMDLSTTIPETTTIKWVHRLGHLTVNDGSLIWALLRCHHLEALTRVKLGSYLHIYLPLSHL